MLIIKVNVLDVYLNIEHLEEYVLKMFLIVWSIILKLHYVLDVLMDLLFNLMVSPAPEVILIAYLIVLMEDVLNVCKDTTSEIDALPFLQAAFLLAIMDYVLPVFNNLSYSQDIVWEEFNFAQYTTQPVALSAFPATISSTISANNIQ